MDTNLRWMSWISFFVSSNVAAVRPSMAISVDSDTAKSWHIFLPMPDPSPVTTITLPAVEDSSRNGSIAEQVLWWKVLVYFGKDMILTADESVGPGRSGELLTCRNDTRSPYEPLIGLHHQQCYGVAQGGG